MCKGINGGSHKHRHIWDMCQTPGYGLDVFSTPKYPYIDCSNTSKWELYYIPKADFFLGHPVYGQKRNGNIEETGNISNCNMTMLHGTVWQKLTFLDYHRLFIIVWPYDNNLPWCHFERFSFCFKWECDELSLKEQIDFGFSFMFSYYISTKWIDLVKVLIKSQHWIIRC